ncbi:hypothetical protein [Ascidiimonas sp. W6]|uniref:hypothetical protein n=1 Tax=Ascidiimonas meishanensis TaxID=3128903 RepID=UPI0030ED2E6F
MKPKYKALAYNFIGFAILFLAARFTLGHFLPINRIFLAVTSAIIANVVAPKFGVVKNEDGEKILMKWIFIKGLRELK